MLIASRSGQQANSFGADLLQQAFSNGPSLHFAGAIPWRDMDRTFARHCRLGLGIPAKPIRLLMAGLLTLRQLEILSGEAVACSSNAIRSIKPFAVLPNSVANRLAAIVNGRLSEKALNPMSPDGQCGTRRTR